MVKIAQHAFASLFLIAAACEGAPRTVVPATSPAGEDRGDVCGPEERSCLRPCYHAAEGAESRWEHFEQEEVGSAAYQPPQVSTAWRPGTDLSASALASLRQEMGGELPEFEFQVAAVQRDDIENGHVVVYRLRHVAYGEAPACGATSEMCQVSAACRASAASR